MTQQKITGSAVQETGNNKDNPRKQIMQLVDKYKQQMMMVLPKHITPDRMARIVLSVMSRNPKLYECTRTSLLGSLLQLSAVGLEPDPVFGHAYLVPFKNRKQINGQWQSVMEVQAIIGYKGFIELARRSKQVDNIFAAAVFTGDDFEYAYGNDHYLKHVPATYNYQQEDKSLREQITHFYAYANLKDGGFQFIVLPRYKVDETMCEVARKNNYKLKDKTDAQLLNNNEITGVWADHYEEMGIKTAIRRLAKFLPMTSEDRFLASAAENADMTDSGKAAIYDVDQFDPETGELLPEYAGGDSDLSTDKEENTEETTISPGAGEVTEPGADKDLDPSGPDPDQQKGEAVIRDISNMTEKEIIADINTINTTEQANEWKKLNKPALMKFGDKKRDAIVEAYEQRTDAIVMKKI